MALHSAHEGYEYQDLLTAYTILHWILEDVESTFLIDVKEYDEDKFDDLTIRNSEGYFKRQIKYSNQSISHSLSKGDLSTAGSYNLALDELFATWQQNSTNDNLDLRLWLSWNEPTDELLKVLKKSTDTQTFKSYNTILYKIDCEKIWPLNEQPLKNWKRFRDKSTNIDRNEFKNFCEVLFIEVDFPKFSLDIYNPGNLEKIVIDQVDSLGIGLFPNNKISKEEFVLRLTSIIRRSRSKNEILTTENVLKEFNIITNYGSIEQIFPINQSKNLIQVDKLNDVKNEILINKKTILVGEPGSGKSWLISNLLDKFRDENIRTIKHYCYTDLQDTYQKDRIKTDIFFGNLISDILKSFPELKKYKERRYASNLSELNLLLSKIEETTILIVDGLDHIKRIFEYRPYYDLSYSDIDIIKQINKITISNHVSIVIASQTVTELHDIIDFKKIDIPKWNLEDSKNLMLKNGLDELRLEENVTLSEFLLKKSNGNPLYLNYLIEELKKMSIITLDDLLKIPNYSFNLSKYYEYLLDKLDMNNGVPFALSAVNFSLNKKELKEITGLGNFVEKSLDILKAILRENNTFDGYIIYHESFRRYIIDFLKSNEVTEKIIFKPVIDWLEKLDFYEYPKANRYYFQLLLDGGVYEKILPFINKKFVKKSLVSGHPWQIIKNNYFFLVRAAVLSKDIKYILVANEINKIIIGTRDAFDENFLYYIESLGHIKGFDFVAKSLSFEGEPTMNMLDGIKVCYLIDSKNEVAPWDYYIDYFKKAGTINLDIFKYYVRALVRQNDNDKISKLFTELFHENFKDFRRPFLNEFVQCGDCELFEEDTLKLRKLVSKKIINESNIYQLINKLLSCDYLGNEDVSLLKKFFEQINYYLIDKTELDNIIGLLKLKNWFYNWIIYYIKIKEYRDENIEDSERLINIFKNLSYDTDPFKGKPRTCDLNSLEGIISQSIDEGLSLVKAKEDWRTILSIVKDASIRSTTFLRNTPNGPFIASNLFKIFVKNLNKENQEIICEVLESIFTYYKDWQFHTFLGEYCFQLVNAFSFAEDKEKVEYYFNLGVQYILGYTWRRDLTLEDLTESIVSFSKVNNDLGNEYILKLKDLVDAVVNHTDGKDTEHFPVEWFEKFFSINQKSATKYLCYELLQIRVDWRLEKSLKYLVENENLKINKTLHAFLNQSFLIESDDSFLISTMKLINKLDKGIVKDSLMTSFKERVAIKQENGRSEHFYEELSKYKDEIKIESNKNIKPHKKYAHNDNVINTFLKENVYRKGFCEMDSNELEVFFNENQILKNDFQSLIYLFDSFQGLNTNLKELIKIIVSKNERSLDKHKNDLSQLFINNSEVFVYYYLCLFVYEYDGWYKSLVNINVFKNAYTLDKEKSIDFLFELIENNLQSGYNRVFSANLFNALAAIQYNSFNLQKAWLSLYDTMEYRFPVVDRYNWNEVLNDDFEMNLDELFVCILLCRFKSFTVEKFHLVTTAISQLLYEDSSLLIKPLKWFFKNNEFFKKSIILSVLQILHDYEGMENDYLRNFEQYIKDIYPSNYYLIDFLIEKMYRLQRNTMIFSHANSLIYPIGDGHYSILRSINEKHYTLENVGLDIENVFGKFVATYSDKYEEYLELYGNNMYRWTVNNIYMSDYLFQLINEDLYENLKSFPNSDDVYNSLKIDTETIIAQQLSKNIRPIDLKKCAEHLENASINTNFPVESEWIRIAHYESELIEEDYHKISHQNKQYGAIVFTESKNPIFPYSKHRLLTNSLWDDNFVLYDVNDTPIFSFIQKDKQFEDYKILWLNPTIVTLLNLKISSFLMGLYASNENGEIVLKFNSWFAEYLTLGYSNNISDEIPKLDGSELLIRKDYFTKLCGLYDSAPKYSIKKV